MKIHKSFGLDLGTTNSTVSIVKNGKILFAEEGRAKNKSIPSVVAIRRDGSKVVGTVAKNEFYSGNMDAVKSIKRQMGKNTSFIIGGEDISPEDISADIISYCRDCLINTIEPDSDVIYDRAVITVPAYFSLAQKDATRKAGELAGIDVQMLLEEPTAAAINYALNNDIENGVFFVFDLGGGTFDVAILEKTGNIPNVLAIAGNNYLGGDNIDFILARYFLDHLKSTAFNVPNIKVDNSDCKFRMLMFAAENVKKQLSITDAYSIYFPDIFKDNSGIELMINDFTRDHFNSLIRDKIETDIVNECDKALSLLEEKSGKTLEDITHIIMVGGSTKIPFVQEVIKEKYCITQKLTDVTVYEPDTSVSAGAAYVANANGSVIEDEEFGILIRMNASYVVDQTVYITGNVERGDITELGIRDSIGEERVLISNDKSFALTASAGRFDTNCTYTFYKDSTLLSSASNEDNSSVDIIAPAPVQNEDIAIEIIDVEKGKVEKYPILSSGTYLPSISTEHFKINEFSKERIVLPVWEGYRRVFDFIIDLPDNTMIGSRIAVETHVDTVSDISLVVKMNGCELHGRYEYVAQEDIEDIQVEKLDNLFEQRIKYVDSEEGKEELVSKKEILDRELREARNNNDKNHFSNVSQKMEKFIVEELPATPTISEKEFNKIGAEIKEKITSAVQYSEHDIDTLCFYGKRFLIRKNTEEAQKCMDELISIKEIVELISSPADFFEQAKASSIALLDAVFLYVKNPSSDIRIVEQLKREIIRVQDDLGVILNKYKNSGSENEMKKDGERLIELTTDLYQIMQKVMSKDDNSLNIFKGLVSKA